MAAPDPVSPSRIIQNYELLSNLARQMREAATHGEWEKLTHIEQQCTDLLEIIKSLDVNITLSEPDRVRKTQLINKILTDHAEVNKCTQDWMKELQSTLETIAQSNRQEQRLHDTYGS